MFDDIALFGSIVQLLIRIDDIQCGFRSGYGELGAFYSYYLALWRKDLLI